MDDLKSMRKFLESNKIKIKKNRVWDFTTTKGDVWSMAHGVYYRNGEPINEKEFVKSFEKPKKKKEKKGLLWIKNKV